MNQCDTEKYVTLRIRAFCLTRFWIIRFKWIPLLLCTSSSLSYSSSLSSSPLSSAGPGAGRCIGRASRVWRTGRQRPPISSQPCLSGEWWCFMDSGTLDMPSSWHGGSVGICYLHLEGDERKNVPLHGTCLSYGAILVVAVDAMSCELVELLYHVLLKVKAVSTLRELPLHHRALCHLVIHWFLTLAVEAWIGITASHTVQLHNTVNHLVSYQVSAEDCLLLYLDTEHTGQLLWDVHCRNIGICISSINDNRATVTWQCQPQTGQSCSSASVAGLTRWCSGSQLSR